MAADTSPSFTFTHIISATLVEDPREQVGTPFFSPDSRPFHSVGGRWTFYHQGLAPMRFGFRWTDLSPGLSVKSILLHLYSSVGSVLGDARVHAIDSEDVRTGRDSDGIVEDSYPMVGQAPPFKVHVAVTMKAAREPQKEHLQVTVRQSATVDTTLARVALRKSLSKIESSRLCTHNPKQSRSTRRKRQTSSSPSADRKSVV